MEIYSIGSPTCRYTVSGVQHVVSGIQHGDIQYRGPTCRYTVSGVQHVDILYFYV